MTWYDLDALVCPMRWRWVLTGRFGFSAITLFVENRYGLGFADDWAEIGRQYFVTNLAFALAGDTVLLQFEQAHLRDPTWNRTLVDGSLAGLNGFTGGDRAQTPCMVWDTDDPTDGAARRVYLPGAPARWIEDGRLTEDGRSGLQTAARSLYCATTNEIAGNFLHTVLVRQRPQKRRTNLPGPLEYTVPRVVRCCMNATSAPRWRPAS